MDADIDDDEGAVARRARDSLARMARRAYEAAHGEPMAAAPRGVRWRVEPKIALSLCLVLGLAIAVVSWSTGPRAVGAQAPEQPSFSSVRPASLVIDVAGAVASPGVFEMPGGARVRDAIDAAGGLLDGADRSSINLARLLVDGEQVYVPIEGEAAGGPVNVNRADAAALEALPGIGPTLAERIVSDREANGPFATLADLDRVSGIGPALVARLSGLASA